MKMNSITNKIINLLIAIVFVTSTVPVQGLETETVVNNSVLAETFPIFLTKGFVFDA
ncbi:MAG: hypothetical protein ACD_79C01457G0002, partial [uncultured bacterium]